MMTHFRLVLFFFSPARGSPGRIGEVWGAPDLMHITECLCVFKRGIYPASLKKVEECSVQTAEVSNGDEMGSKGWKRLWLPASGIGEINVLAQYWANLTTLQNNSQVFLTSEVSGLLAVILTLTALQIPLKVCNPAHVAEAPCLRITTLRLRAFFDGLCCSCSSWRKFARLCGVQTEDLRWALPPGAQQWLARHLLQVCRAKATFP